MSDVNNQYDFFKEVNIDANGNLGVVVSGGGGSSDTIYTADGTISGNRTVDLNSNSLTFSNGNISVTGTVDGRDISTDGTKLDTIETGADVTDATNVDTAGALMRTGGAMTGDITTNSNFDGRNVSVDGIKLDTISTNADVTLDSISAGSNITISPAGVIASTGGGGGSGIGTTVLVEGQMNTTQSFTGLEERMDYVDSGFDINGEWDNTTHRFTVGSSGDGVYQFINTVFVDNAGGWIQIFCKKNGVSQRVTGSDFASSWDTPMGTTNIELVVGDYVEFWIDSTSSFSVNASWYTLNNFQITKIGDSSVVNNIVAQTLNRGLTLEEPTVNDDITIFRTDVAIVIQEVIAVSTGTSSDTTYDIKYSTDRSAAGTSLVSSEQTTSVSTGDVAIINNTNIPANSYVWLEVSAASGTDVYLNLDIRYTEA
jgi:hypothetical protein